MNERDDMASEARVESKLADSSAAAPMSAKKPDISQPVVSQSSTPQTKPPVIPDYELLRRIGGGSYGEVWLARSATGVLRALKIVYRSTFEEDRPFRREFEGIQRFERISREHPGQLALFHVGRNDGEGYFYYVMELADGEEMQNAECKMTNKAAANPTSTGRPQSILNSEFFILNYRPHTLRADLEQGRLPAQRVLEVGLALTEALAHLHANGLVHRDVKPSNVIFVNGRPKLADIGLVTDTGDTRSIVGTEGYLASEGPGTPQADIFALGKVLYEALTGLDRRQLPQLPPALRAWPDAQQVFELNEVILKACATDMRERYATADAMRADLELLQRGKSVKRKRSSQHRWAVFKKAVVALSVLLVVAASVLLLRRQSVRADFASDGSLSTNMEANAVCQSGLNIIRGDFYADFPKAYTNFHQAIELDSHFARPYVGLLELLLREGNPNVKSGQRELQNVTQKLEDLAPHSAPTYCARSIRSWFDWNYPQAKRFAEQAIKADPTYELGHTWHGFLLTIWGWPSEGRAELETALKLAPSKVTIYRVLGQTYYAERDFTNAIAWELKALDREPHHGGAFYYIGRSYQALGNYTNAMDNLEMASIYGGKDAAETRKFYAQLRQAYDKDGARGYWHEQWSKTANDKDGNFYWKAVCQISLGDTNAALGWLEKSYDNQERNEGEIDSPLSYFLLDEWWDGLRDEPRIKALLDKIGFTKVMPPNRK